jgi:hypothetical protein
LYHASMFADDPAVERRSPNQAHEHALRRVSGIGTDALGSQAGSTTALYTALYRCCAACAEVPSSSPMRAHVMPAW